MLDRLDQLDQHAERGLPFPFGSLLLGMGLM